MNYTSLKTVILVSLIELQPEKLYLQVCAPSDKIFPHRALYRHSGSVVELPLCDREVAGSIPGRVIPKTLKMVLAALSLGAQH